MNTQDSVFCRTCGNKLAQRSAATVALPGPMTQPLSPVTAAIIRDDPFTCPVCQSKEVQKVSAIYNQGSWQGVTSNVSVGAGHVFGAGHLGIIGGGISDSSGATSLATMIAPPVMPTLSPIGATCGTCAASLIVPYLVLVYIGFGWSLLALVAVPVMAISAWNQKSAAFDREQKVIWHQRIGNWERLIYCTRCDHVYRGDTGEAAEARNARALY